MKHLRLAVLCALLPSAGCNQDEDSPTGTLSNNDPSAAFFNESEVPDIHLTISEPAFASIIDDPENETFREAMFQWKDRTVNRVGLQPSSAPKVPGNQKMSMIVVFDAFVPGQRFLGLRQVKLDGLADDPSMMRDRLSYAMFRSVMPASRSGHCRVFVNGAYRGVYEVEEMIDETFVRRNFGGTLGHLYYMLNATVDPYLWQGPDLSRHVPLPLRPETLPDGDHTPVLQMIDTLNNNPSQIGTIVDLPTLVAYFAVEAVIADQHGFAGDLIANNHYQYLRTETGRFHILAFDLADTWGGGDESPQRSIWQNFQNSKLSAVIEDTPALRQAYKAKIAELIATTAGPAALAARIDSIYEQIRDAAYADPYKPWANDHFDWSRDFIKQFMIQRVASLQSQSQAP
ncbi:MAG: CotH kinase family protein [Planctomycetes bacterium]|nr:CotH kinase family protein [Planctomycetota bacterium]